MTQVVLMDYESSRAAFNAAADKHSALVHDFQARVADEQMIITVLTPDTLLYTTADTTLRGCWHVTDVGLRLFDKPIQWSLMTEDGRCVSGGFAATSGDACRRMAHSARAQRAESELAAVCSQMMAAFNAMMAFSSDQEDEGEAADE